MFQRDRDLEVISFHQIWFLGYPNNFRRTFDEKKSKDSSPSHRDKLFTSFNSNMMTKKNRERERDFVTFFFCLPPPDLAGLEDGGGALSFFGACKITIPRDRERVEL